jgi:hypothetical protein
MSEDQLNDGLGEARRQIGDKAIEVMDLVTPELVALLQTQADADYAVADYLTDRGLDDHETVKFMVGTLLHRLIAPEDA